jgi:formamidopyrimidine-DNA glycosylase
MPELPEVETMVRGIRPHVEGARIQSVIEPPCSCRPILVEPGFEAMNRQVRGLIIEKVFRRAKRVVLQLESGAGFVIEPRMTGLMLVEDPPDVGHLRVQWNLQRAGKKRPLWFWDRRGLGTVRLLAPDPLKLWLTDGPLGRDALEMSARDWMAALSKTSREVKVALLDQRLAAGIGNLYASEILHRAGISPYTPASRISKVRAGRLFESVQTVLLAAIEHEGSTLSDGTYRNALNQAGSYQNAHRVYDREGEPCPQCATAIRRIVQAQRSTFFCPRCQR